MAELTAAGDEALVEITDDDPVRRARRRLRELGRTYVAFARSQAGSFRVALAAHPSLAEAPEAPEVGVALAEAGPFGQLSACLDDLTAVGYLAPEARPGAEFTCWAGVHGMAMLLLEGPIQGLPDEVAAEIVDQMLIALDRSSGATTGSYAPL